MLEGGLGGVGEANVVLDCCRTPPLMRLEERREEGRRVGQIWEDSVGQFEVVEQVYGGVVSDYKG